jgi:hypothetical protein
MSAIIPKPKPCKDGGHMAYLWSHGYCKKHWMIRTAKKQIAENKPMQDKLGLWYRKIYDLYNGICAESGYKLSFDKRFCAHLLNKAKYEYFKFDLRNGILLDLQYHDILDHGGASQRKELKVWEYISLQRKMLLEEVGMSFDEEFWLNMKT